MERRHFEALAGALRSVKPDRGNKYAPRSVQSAGGAAHAQWLVTIGAVATACAQFNPAFQRERFLRACGDSEE